MGKQSVVIDLPEDVYNRLKERASQTNRSVEAAILEAAIKLASEPADEISSKLSPELEKLVANLASLDDAKLQKIARKKFNRKDSARIETLHFQRQDTGLSEEEEKELAELMQKFSHWFVSRNQALNLLFDRGYDVNKFAPKVNS